LAIQKLDAVTALPDILASIAQHELEGGFLSWLMSVRVATPFHDDTIFTFCATGEGIGQIAPCSFTSAGAAQPAMSSVSAPTANATSGNAFINLLLSIFFLLIED
jgi:hypothetical protein